MTAQAVAAAAQPAQPADPTADFKQRLDKLVMMRDAKLLSDEEFASMKAALLAEIKR